MKKTILFITTAVIVTGCTGCMSKAFKDVVISPVVPGGPVVTNKSTVAIVGEVNLESVQGVYGHVKLSSPSANGLPDLSGGIGNVQVFRAPVFASVDGKMKVEAAPFATGAGANQNMSSSLLGAAGSTYFVLGKVNIYVTSPTNSMIAPVSSTIEQYPSPLNRTNN